MQNRYVGDIGDYVKLGILRALSPGYRFGVAWWLHPDENHNRDGRHIGYLDRPDQWRHFDPALFDTLRQIVSSGRRNVRMFGANLLPGAVFANDMIPVDGPIGQRSHMRREWLERVRRILEDVDLMFVDPDNGLEPEGFTYGSAKAGKSVSLRELRALARPGRCLVVYHHHTRRKGGHRAEIEHCAEKLRQSGFGRIDALRATPFSPRAFFLLDAPDDVRLRAEKVEVCWDSLITWHPNIGPGGIDRAIAPAEAGAGRHDVMDRPR
jgi:hypothetical protein